MWGQHISLTEEQNYLLEVKQVDEFIDRFNFDRNTLVIRYLSEHFPAQVLSRQDLVLSLFNHGQHHWDTVMVRAFVKQVTQPDDPVYLSFYDEDWYAELACDVMYRDAPRKATLIMQVQQDKQGGASWVVRAVKANFLDELPDSGSEDQVVLNPMSHGTDFMGLRRVLSDPDNLRNIVFSEFAPESMSLFMHELRNGNLVFRQVNDISYHFLQVPGWRFTLRRYLRNSHNSGWLIDELRRATEPQKAQFRHQQLNLR
ncbi:MAG: hypothetical protein D6722_00455 [Bacteroidetes bacterium]|nr:MAG: hypothetical protein D6722_00455 [Bacteroidota bacterium]